MAAALCAALAGTVSAGPALAGPAVDAPGRLPETPPSVADLAYDSRLLASAAAAERFQGALDGGWTLSAEGGGDLYAFQLTDRREALEGAWRDLARAGQPGASGLVDELQRTPDRLVIRFTPSAQPPATVNLRPAAGALRGELDQAGRRTPVVLRKTGP